MVYCIVFGAGFLAFGLGFCKGKLLEKIPGWTEMPSQVKRNIRILPLCRNIGCAICLAGVLLLLGGVFPAFREGAMSIVMLAWSVLCIGDLIFISKSGRYVQRAE